MMRGFLVIGALLLIPTASSAQRPCTNDTAAVVTEIHRQILERTPDNVAPMAQQLANGSVTVRDLVRELARSTEHAQRFLSPFDTPQQRLNVICRCRRVEGPQFRHR